MPLLPCVYLTVLAGLFTFSMACSDSPEAGAPVELPPYGESKAVVAGQAGFETRCVTCHGSDGTAGIGGAFNLKTSTLDSSGIAAVILEGRRTMPPFKEALSAAEVAELVNYVKQLRK
jgi:mono/diheme cytochrome c family protein